MNNSEKMEQKPEISFFQFEAMEEKPEISSLHSETMEQKPEISSIISETMEQKPEIDLLIPETLEQNLEISSRNSVTTEQKPQEQEVDSLIRAWDLLYNLPNLTQDRKDYIMGKMRQHLEPEKQITTDATAVLNTIIAQQNFWNIYRRNNQPSRSGQRPGALPVVVGAAAGLALGALAVYVYDTVREIAARKLAQARSNAALAMFELSCHPSSDKLYKQVCNTLDIFNALYASK